MAQAQPNSPALQGRSLPIRAGTRGSPLALVQTRMVMARLAALWPAPGPGEAAILEERIIRTTGDAVQDRPLTEIGGKGLFSKEIHEQLLDGRIDLAVHSLKDLETELPAGVVLACTLPREDARDAMILGPHLASGEPTEAFALLPANGVIGTTSLRRQAQLLHARPDLQIVLMRGNVQTRIDKVMRGDCAASLLAVAGLRRLGITTEYVPIDPEAMVPAAGQGIVGVTVRESDHAIREMLSHIEDASARAVSTAERALLAALDGSCHTPIGGHARLLPDGRLHLTGLVARADGSFLLKRSVHGPAADAHALGASLGAELRADSPRDVFAPA